MKSKVTQPRRATRLLSRERSLLRALWLLFACALTAPRAAAWAQSDAELLTRLEEPSSDASRVLINPTTIFVWPAHDLRPLFSANPDPVALKEREEELERAELSLLQALGAYRNLRVKPPAETLKMARERSAYQRVLSLARGFARRGVRSYREVELAQGLTQLESAIELFEQAQQHSVDPSEVAQLYLTLGLIAVEQSRMLPAHLAFREALLLNPRLRVRADFDGANVARSFEEARAQLIALPVEELTRLAERALRHQRTSASAQQLRLWRTPSGLSSALYLWRGEHLEVKRDQSFGLEPQALSALSARVWSCVPLSRNLSNSSERQLRLDASLSGLSFASTPLSFVLFRGGELSASLDALDTLSLLVGGAWHISGRDQREDLRLDVSSYELYLGPQWRFGAEGAEGISGSLSLSAVASYMSRAMITREVGCKYFELVEALPPQLCQPARDITRFDPSWGIGPRLDLRLRVPIARALSLHLRLSSSSALYLNSARPFELPISLGLGLGYIFHLKGD